MYKKNKQEPDVKSKHEKISIRAIQPLPKQSNHYDMEISLSMFET